MVKDDEKRLVIDLNDINDYDPNLRKNILENPMNLLPAWEDSLKDYIDHSDFQSKVSYIYIYIIFIFHKNI